MSSELEPPSPEPSSQNDLDPAFHDHAEISLGPLAATMMEEASRSGLWEVYPPIPSHRSRIFAPGSHVWVLMSGKPFAKAVVGATSAFPGRILVQYNDGSHYHCRPERMCSLYGLNGASTGQAEPKTTIVVCAETDQYRQLARLLTLPGDSALEIGADLGACTAVLSASVTAGGAAGRAVGVDKSSKSVDEARRRFPHIPFHCIDVLANREPALGIPGESRSSHFDVIFVDINGNRLIDAVAEVVHLSRTSFDTPPRLVVVKSKQMAVVLRSVLDRPPVLS